MKPMKFVAAGLAIASLSACTNAPSPHVDTLYVGGTIVEADSTCSGCAVAVSQGIIEGIYQEKTDWPMADTVIDITGQFLYPGFIDAHAHFVGYGKSLQTVDLRGTSSWEEVIEKTLAFAEGHPNAVAITGRGWDQNDWEVKEFPTNQGLSEAFPSIPVVLTRIDGHAVIANDEALRRADINASNYKERTPSGGDIQVDENGTPTGVLIDNAVDLLVLPEWDDARLTRALLDAERNCFAVGLTSVVDAGLDQPVIEAIDSLQDLGILRMPLYAMVSDKLEWLEHYLAHGPIKTDRLNVRSFKFYGDGALGSRGACLRTPYHDAPGHYGLMLSTREHFLESAKRLAAAGWQMNTHAIGDSANHLILNVYKEALAGSTVDHRWRIEHAQVVSPEDWALFADLDVIPSIQPTHATSDMYWAGERLGEERIKHAYAYNDLLQSRGLVAIGTDFPIEHIDPIHSFYAAVVRKDHSGYPEGGFQTENALSREDALRGMTIWAAYANFEEEEKGSITPGKWADFTILDTDLLHCSENEILQSTVNYTVVHGEIVHTH